MRLFLGICFAVILGAGLFWAYDNYHGYVRNYYQHKRFPDLPSRDSKLSASMDQQITLRKYEEVMREHERVSSLIDQAEKDGFDASALRERLPRVVRLAREGQYVLAKVHLNSIRLRIPRKRETVHVASGDENGDNYFPEPGSGRKIRPIR